MSVTWMSSAEGPVITESADLLDAETVLWFSEDAWPAFLENSSSRAVADRRAMVVNDLEAKLLGHGDSQGDFWLQVSADHYLPVIDYLRNHSELKFDSFVDLCGVDYHPRSPRFEVVVHLFSQPEQWRIRIRCEVPDRTLAIPSLTGRWKGANWQEREAFDMYGIIFDGHPDLRRILLPEDYPGHPVRKDFKVPEFYNGMKVPY